MQITQIDWASAQWFEMENQLNSLRAWNDIEFPTVSDGYIVGSHGLLLKTINGGDQWVISKLDSSETLSAIDFPTISTGYIVGSGGLMLKTTDAGITWSKLSFSSSDYLMDVEFVTDEKGFVGSKNGLLFTTTDGGQNWTSQNLGTYEIYNIIYTSDSVGFLLANEYVFNPGQTTVFKTIDSGDSWFELPNSFFLETMTSAAYFVNNDIGYVSNSGLISKTMDGGNSWQTVFEPGGFGYSQAVLSSNVFFLNPDTGLVAFQRKIMRTYNGGTDWILEDLDSLMDPMSIILKVYCVDQLDCYGIGWRNLLLSTRNDIVVLTLEDGHHNRLRTTINAFPNPFSQTVSIEFSDYNLFKGAQLVLTNILGQEIRSWTVTSNIELIDNLASGVYFLTVSGFVGGIKLIAF